MKTHYLAYQKWDDGIDTVSEVLFLTQEKVIDELSSWQDDGRTFEVVQIDLGQGTALKVTQDISLKLAHYAHENGVEPHPMAKEDHQDLQYAA